MGYILDKNGDHVRDSTGAFLTDVGFVPTGPQSTAGNVEGGVCSAVTPTPLMLLILGL